MTRTVHVAARRWASPHRASWVRATVTATALVTGPVTHSGAIRPGNHGEVRELTVSDRPWQVPAAHIAWQVRQVALFSS